MFQELKIEDLKIQSKEIDFNSIERNSFIDVSVQIERPPVAIGLGSYEYKGNLYPIP